MRKVGLWPVDWIFHALMPFQFLSICIEVVFCYKLRLKPVTKSVECKVVNWRVFLSHRRLWPSSSLFVLLQSIRRQPRHPSRPSSENGSQWKIEASRSSTPKLLHSHSVSLMVIFILSTISFPVHSKEQSLLVSVSHLHSKILWVKITTKYLWL